MHPNWPMEAKSTNLPRNKDGSLRGVRFDHHTQSFPTTSKVQGEVSAINGVLLELQTMFPPANQVFTEEEMDARLERIGARLRAEEERLREADRQGRLTITKTPPRTLVRHLPPHWIICNCSVCHKILLSKTQMEALRYSMVWVRKRGLDFVAGRTADDRPLCTNCKETYDDEPH